MSQRNKSGLLPHLYSQLTEEEKNKVKTSMTAYNNIYSDQPYYEVDQYYQQIFRRVLGLRGGCW